MAEGSLPLDHDRYHDYLARLRELVEAGGDLPEEESLRSFFLEHRGSFGPRTAELMARTGRDEMQALLHVMVLGASELSDLHEESRKWLADRDHPLPPWDVTVPRTAQRLVAFAGTVYGVVEWEPRRSVELSEQLTAAERQWATALAVGIGERPQWTSEEVGRFAAYLVMGTGEFAEERERTDEQLSERHGVPVEAVRLRRTLPDDL